MRLHVVCACMQAQTFHCMTLMGKAISEFYACIYDPSLTLKACEMEYIIVYTHIHVHVKATLLSILSLLTIEFLLEKFLIEKNLY